MTATLQEAQLLEVLGDDVYTTRLLAEKAGLTVRQVAAALGRMRKRGQVRQGRLPCPVCGQGVARVWMRPLGGDPSPVTAHPVRPAS